MIKLDNVYIQKDQKLILKNINLKINDKEKVFVIGSSGAGKTTLINSFMDSSIIKKGNIFINDINIKKINKKQMKKINSNYGFLSQKDFFIN
jgi:ABC-type phosphate/phosphonate transport system ATPase subunit